MILHVREERADLCPTWALFVRSSRIYDWLDAEGHSFIFKREPVSRAPPREVRTAEGRRIPRGAAEGGRGGAGGNWTAAKPHRARTPAAAIPHLGGAARSPADLSRSIASARRPRYSRQSGLREERRS